MTESRRWTTGQPRWQCSICGQRFPDATRLSQHACPQRHSTPDEATEQEIQDLAHKIAAILRAQGVTVDTEDLQGYLRRYWPPRSWDPIAWADAYRAELGKKDA
jgi:hypothetical protein